MDEKVKALLQRAAYEPAFFEQLLNRRDEALAGVDLSEAERQVLLAASDDQVRGMVEQLRKKPRYDRPIRAAGLAAGAAVVGTIFMGLTATAGVSVERVPTTYAASCLHQISLSQEIYHNSHGEYATLQAILQEYESVRDSIESVERKTSYWINLRLHEKGYELEAVDSKGVRPAVKRFPDGSIRPVDTE